MSNREQRPSKGPSEEKGRIAPKPPVGTNKGNKDQKTSDQGNSKGSGGSSKGRKATHR